VVIAALLSHKNLETAARAAEISLNTLKRWLKDAEFDAAYREARRAAFCQSIAWLQEASGAAAKTVLRIMLDPKVSAGTRLHAAEVVLSQGARALEFEDIEARLAELERTRSTTTTRKRAALFTLVEHQTLSEPATTPAPSPVAQRRIRARVNALPAAEPATDQE
jgi:hypothetical protein